MMIKNIIATVALLLSLNAMAQTPLTKDKSGLYTVNTTTLCDDIIGFAGTTPLEITILKDKIVEVKKLKNKETAGYFRKIVRGLLPKYKGKSVQSVLNSNVDGITGATLSSRAVIENVKSGLAYYKKNKKKVKAK